MSNDAAEAAYDREAIEDVLRDIAYHDLEYLNAGDSNLNEKLFGKTQRLFVDDDKSGRVVHQRDRIFEGLESPAGGRMGYLNEWVVHLEGGRKVASRVLANLDFELIGTVKGFSDLYRVSRRNHPRIHKRAAEELTVQLNSHDQIVWAEQQESRVREKRRILHDVDGGGDKPLVRVKLSVNKPKQTSLVESEKLLEDKQHLEAADAGDSSGVRVRRAVKDSSAAKNSLQEDSKHGNWDANQQLVNRLKHWGQKDRLSDSKQDISDIFNDELVDHQWYIFDTRVKSSLPKLDLGVLGAWQLGYTGQGVKVTILDDGIDYTHDDLKDNYDPSLSFDVNDDDDDPLPRQSDQVVNSHGTKCAGEVAMVANNGKCGVGVAFLASIGGVRMLDGDVSDRVEAEALSHAIEKADIASSSWGPMDDGKTVEGPGRLTQEALKRGTQEGRGGKGTLFVWASGNGGLTNDNCNCDGYASSIYTISINSASQSNKFPWYGERCASTMASAYSSGAYTDQKIISTDVGNKCTSSFSGTSAAAPLTAGVVALALEANGNLTWRDMQHLIILSCNALTLKENDGWQQNALGLYFNMRFGFGLLDAESMVVNAKSWESVGEKVTCTVNATSNKNTNWSFGSQGSTSLLFEVTGCSEGGKKGVFLEHVEAVMSIEHTYRGALEINITSPRGTTTTYLTTREQDKSSEGFHMWPFVSLHTWGEDPRGAWTITITDTSSGGEHGSVTQAQLLLHAATAVPSYAQQQYKKQYKFHASMRKQEA
uniref:Neuroendocrine convertase 1-like n=1 Tax=Hirondellea gigas TaxID=1518452 RepID=A0A6A7FR57_9CRUS